jgi:RimJ/RimL family protein N-acetyltransferase
MKHVVDTPRLILREMSLGDLDFIAAMMADPEVMRYYPKCYSRDEAHSWVERQMNRYTQHGHGLWLVSEKANGQRVGQVGLIMQNVRGVEEIEVGYLIHRPFWRRAYATEAALACRDYAFDVLGRQQVISLIRPENGPSQGVAMKLGMTPESCRIQHGSFEHMVFSISRMAWQNDWPPRKGL